MAEETKAGPYTEDDMVKVVDTTSGQVLEHPVPKAWLEDGNEFGRGLKKATKTQAAKAPGPDEEPAGNASRDEWAAYARNVKGATDADLVDGDGKDLGRDEIRAKYGTPSE